MPEGKCQIKMLQNFYTKNHKIEMQHKFSILRTRKLEEKWNENMCTAKQNLRNVKPSNLGRSKNHHSLNSSFVYKQVARRYRHFTTRTYHLPNQQTQPLPWWQSSHLGHFRQPQIPGLMASQSRDFRIATKFIKVVLFRMLDDKMTILAV